MDRAEAVTEAGESAAKERFWRKAGIILVVLTGVLYFARLGARALWASEFRWAEIAREMILTRNYFWPTINGHLYYDKPLGSYWLVVASTYLTGGMNEAAARFPSAVAGLIAVMLLIGLARDLYDLRTGVIAATILATSFSFVFFSRHADADAITVTGELAALWLFWRNHANPSGRWLIPFWLLMAVTSLMKGLLGFVLPLVVVGSYCTLADGLAGLKDDLLRGSLLDRLIALIKRNRWFFNWYTPLAVVLSMVTYYWPFAISYEKTGSISGLYMVYRENVQRFFDPFDHVGPIYLYVYVIFGLMAPWSVFLPAGLWRAHAGSPSSDDETRSDRFVLIFFWVVFLFFTASGSRRSYYLLPILPAASIIVARLFIAPFAVLPRWSFQLLKLGFALLGIAVALSFIGLVPPRLYLPGKFALMPNAPDQPILILYLVGAALGVAIAIGRRFTPLRIFFASATISWLFMFYFYVFAMPAGDAWRGEKSFAHQVRGIIGADTDGLAFFDNTGPAYYLELPKPVPSLSTKRELEAGIKAGKIRWIVTLNRDLGRLEFPNEIVARELVNPWDSKEHEGNSMILVHVIPKT